MVNVKLFEYNSIVPIAACFNNEKKKCIILQYDGKELWIIEPRKPWRILKNKTKQEVVELMTKLIKENPDVEVYYVEKGKTLRIYLAYL